MWVVRSVLLLRRLSEADVRAARAVSSSLDSEPESEVRARTPLSTRRTRRSRSFWSTQERTGVGR